VVRILVLNYAVPVDKRGGEEWRELAAVAQGEILYATTAEDLIDFDVFVIDRDKVQQVSSTPSESKLIGGQIFGRIQGGGCAVIFCGEKAITWLDLPQPIVPVSISGERVTITTNNEPVAAFLDRLKDELSYRSQFDPPDGWEPLAKALNNRAVSAMRRFGSGLVIVLPEFRSRPRAIRDLLNHVIPHLLPDLARPTDPAVGEEAPEWVSEFKVPQTAELEQELSQLEAQILQLRDTQSEKERQRRELLQNRGLLWLDGFALERAVAGALELLGIAVRPQGTVDLVHEKGDGTRLYIEVEGTEGLVQLRKGQQLLTYIAQADDPASTSGAIIANPYRKQIPADRPTDEDRLFSPPLRALAEKQGWRILTTVKLFELVQSHLSGEADTRRQAMAALGL
jgi:hypothetical protein